MIGKNTLSEFFNISPTPSLVLHIDAPKFTIVEVNKAYLEATNSKREDLIGKGIFEAFPDNDLDSAADGVKNLSHSLHTVVQTNKRNKMAIQKYDIPIRGTSKFELKYWEPENIPLLNDTSELQYIIHCVLDVTEKVKAEKRLKEFEYFFKNSNDFSCIANDEGYFEIANSSFNTILGYSQNELTTKPFIDFVHPDDIDSSLQAYNQLKSGEKVIHFTNRYRKKDGSYLWLDWNATPNSITGKIYCIARDISERKKAEEESIKANKKFSSIFDFSPVAISITKVSDGTFIQVNDAFCDTTGYKSEDLIGKKSVDVKIIDTELRQKLISKILKDENQKKDIEGTIKKPNGELLEVLYRVEKIEIDDEPCFISALIDVTAQKKVEEQLNKLNEILEQKVQERTEEVKKALNRFEYVTKATFDAIWDCDLVEDKIYWGDGFKKIFGYNLKELNDNSASWMENVHPDDLEKITNSYHTTINSKENNWIEEYRYKKNDGNYCYVINKGIIIRDKNGKANRIICAMQDISKKKEEEVRLKLLESVVTNTNDAIVIKEAVPSDESGRKIVYVNNSFTRMSGYKPEEIIGKTHQLLQGPNTDKKELALFYKSLDNWKPCEITIINYSKEGKEYWVNLSLNPVTNEKGEYTHWISIERDVTERKKQEKELYITTLKLFDTLESIQDGFYTLDNNWNVTYWNKVAEAISGMKENAMIGKNFWEIYEGRISEKIHSAFLKAKLEKKPVRLETYSKARKMWFELNAFPSSIGLTVYFKNITERKATETKLKKSNKALENNLKELAISNQELEQFAYVASHDLQEPLRMVTSFLTQIENKYQDVLDEKGKKYIFFAVDGAKRMRQIILDLLDFSRIGKHEDKLEEVNLNSVLDEIRLLYRSQIEEKNATMEYGKLPKIQTFASPIKQVFQNLIGNALKYSKPNEKPIITISSDEHTNYWQFKITDNGIGINEEYFDKIFVIFQRLHTTDQYAGTGIGLAISKKIIDNLKGQIWLESKEGQGSTFYFTIPKNKQHKL
ncbi:PAS domain S-box protein [Flavobacterium sp. N1994]|uniref:PAS domain S-box protein n=1 Tax=Flavobacterium sp. N1994 TaxID=2986827 RepID=UPI0022227C96|nr:PAS domain S-box protein [Flavobacterium sp. N1994]